MLFRSPEKVKIRIFGPYRSRVRTPFPTISFCLFYSYVFFSWKIPIYPNFYAGNPNLPLFWRKNLVLPSNFKNNIETEDLEHDLGLFHPFLR